MARRQSRLNTHGLERVFEHRVGSANEQKGQPPTTTEDKEMKLPGLLIPNQIPGHGDRRV